MSYNNEALENFLQHYDGKLDIRVKKYITRHISDEENERISIISEIRSLCDYDNYEEDKYKNIFNELKNNYDLNCNVLEVGAGFFPVMSYYIDDYQKTNGTISAIDPNIIDKKIGNVKLIKDKFSAESYKDDYDLIFGVYPCCATKEIILSANKLKKPFLIALCGCYDADITIDYAKNTKEDNAVIDVKYVDGSSYPVIEKKFLK